MERKLIELLIGEDGMGLPVEAISLVKFPAIEENFLFFSKGKNTKALSLAKVDEDKRTLIGAALIPDKNIPRYDEMNDEEYDVFFSKETVKLASEMYMKNSRTNEHTLEHEVPVEDVHVVESWIVSDPDMDKSKHYGLDLPEGSWCVRMKVENDELWSQVKEGSIRGLSIEGYFIDKVEEMSVKVKTPNFKKNFKKLWFNIKRKFYSEITLSDGVVIATEDDSFKSGSTVIAIDSEGLPTELASGKYITQAGVNLEVFEGVLIEWDGEVEAIEESQAEAENDEEVEMEKVELDQMKVSYYKALLKGKMKDYLGNSIKLSILGETKKEIKMTYQPQHPLDRMDEMIDDIVEDLQSWGGRVESSVGFHASDIGGFTEQYYTIDISDSPLLPEQIENIAYDLDAYDIKISKFGGEYQVEILMRILK